MLAQVIVLLVLLTWWHDFPAQAKPFQVLEFFAGVARVASLAKFMGYCSAAVDINYGKEHGTNRGSRPPMDINSNAGLMCLGLICKCNCYSFKMF